MKFSVCITFLVLSIADKSLARQSCQTCRGADCLTDNPLQLDCTKFVPALPFESQLIMKDTRGKKEYGCLDLEYYQGEALDYIQQCIVSSDLQSFCDTLEYSIKVKKCRVESTDYVRAVRSINVLALEKSHSSTDSSTNPSKDPSTDSSTNPSKDPSTDSSTNPSKDPSTDSSTNPSKDPSTDSSTNPSKDPSTDSSTNPSKAPSTDSSTNPSKDPSTDSSTNPSKDPLTDSSTNPSKDPSTDSSTNPSKDPSTDAPSTPADPTTDAPPETTTSHASAMHIILLPSLFAALILYIL